MLVLFPFEEAIYRKEGIPVTYVGHPLADVIPLVPDRSSARARLGIAESARLIAILPGSRSSEVRLIAPRFLQAAQQMQQRDASLHFVVPMVSQARKEEFEAALALYPVRNLQILLSSTETGVQTDPIAWLALEACDAALVASGTATLETALFKRPMVISYAVTPMIRRVMGWTSGQQRPYLPWVGLPNILLNDFVVPELIQDDATPEKLATAMWELLDNPSRCELMQSRFTEMHHTLKRDTPSRVAQALEQIVYEGR